MEKVSLSIKIYIGLIITLAILAAINVFLPQGALNGKWGMGNGVKSLFLTVNQTICQE